jgi:hypothetical protein
MTKLFKKATKFFHKVPVVGKVVREIARIGDQIIKVPEKVVHKAVNDISGRTKIKKKAEEQQAQQRSNINEAKQRTLATLSTQYQQCLSEISNSKTIIANRLTNIIADKHAAINSISTARSAVLANNNNLATDELNNVIQILDQQANDLLTQLVEEIRELEHDLLQINQLESNIETDQQEAPRVLAELTQQLQTRLDTMIAAIEEKYNNLAEQQQSELTSSETEEHRIESEYLAEQNEINNRYNAHLNAVLHNIESWKKQASRRATRHFAINIASNIAANLIAPGISSAIGVTSKLGGALVQSVSCTTIDSIATGKMKHLPRSILKNAVTSGVTTIVQSGLEELLTPSNSNGLVVSTENNVVNSNRPVNHTNQPSRNNIGSRRINNSINNEPIAARTAIPKEFESSRAVFSNQLHLESINRGSHEISRTKSRTFCGYKGQRFNVGVTPYTNNRAATLAATPGAIHPTAGIVNQGSAGINIAEINFNKANISLDVLRLDTQIASEITTSLNGANNTLHYSADIAAAAAVVTAEIGPLKIPGTNLQCQATAKTALFGFKHHYEHGLNQPRKFMSSVKPIDFVVSGVCSPVEAGVQPKISGP